jgi:predicted RNA-binding protein with PUA-like domain
VTSFGQLGKLNVVPVGERVGLAPRHTSKVGQTLGKANNCEPASTAPKSPNPADREKENPLAFWLLKTEPETWSWEMQVKRGARGEVWSGVRNHTAKNNLIKMKKGEYAFFYHSGKTKEIVGIAEVIREAYLDPTNPAGKFVAVTVKAQAPLKQPVTLNAIKREARLEAMMLVNNSRLSVQPVAAAEWKIICSMGGLRG